MRLKNILFFVFLHHFLFVKSQDTFSILAFDSITGEVGAAGASCVDLFPFPGYSNDFIAELFPGKGAIATQAAYLPANQLVARNRFNLGDSPNQLINFLVTNDAQNNPTVRQYGVVRLDSIYPRSAGYTGVNCMNYKNHILGPNYSIHGNILLGAQVLDSMEARYTRARGDLACKLMAALQGANMVGADTRCTANGSSSLFAFIKVSQPTDVFGQPSFLLSLKTQANAGIEPIDSLQKMFSAVRTCTVSSNTSNIVNQQLILNDFAAFPNPVNHQLIIKTGNSLVKVECVIRNVFGEQLLATDFINELHLNTGNWDKGVVFIELKSGKNRSIIKKVIVE